MARILHEEAREGGHGEVVFLLLQAAPREFVEGVGAVFRGPGRGRGLRVERFRGRVVALFEEQFGLEQFGPRPLVGIGGGRKKAVDLLGGASVTLRDEADQTVEAGFPRRGRSRKPGDQPFVKIKGLGLLAELAPGIGREQQHLGLRAGRQAREQRGGAVGHRLVFALLVVETQQAGLGRRLPSARRAVGRGLLEQGPRCGEIAHVDGEESALDGRGHAHRRVGRRGRELTVLPEGALAETGTRIGFGEVEHGAFAVGVVTLLRGDVAVGRECLDAPVGGVERAALEKFRSQAQLRIAHVVRGEPEGSGGRLVVPRGELHFAEPVGGRADKIAAVEFLDQFRVGRHGLGLALERAQTLAETEKRGLAVRAARTQLQEFAVLVRGQLEHLLLVECVGLLERGEHRVAHGGRRQGADFAGRHGIGGGGGGGRDRLRAGRGRLGATHLDRFFLRHDGGRRDEQREKLSHDPGRPVAKATFQMLAARQMSSTATMCR